MADQAEHAGSYYKLVDSGSHTKHNQTTRAKLPLGPRGANTKQAGIAATNHEPTAAAPGRSTARNRSAHDTNSPGRCPGFARLARSLTRLLDLLELAYPGA